MEFERKPGHIYAVGPTGNKLAEITFPSMGGVAVINHTFVDHALRGQGIAARLVEAAAEQIRASGLRARPTCSYAVKWFEEHPEQADLLI